MFFTFGHADNRIGAIWNDEWHAMLPNTPMPNVIKDLIKTDANGRMSASRFPVHFIVNGSYNELIFFLYQVDSKFVAGVHSLFLEKNMHPEMEIKGVSFAGTITGNTFIPRGEADSIPFSSTKLNQILDRLSVAPESEAAKHVEETLRLCEQASHLEGEIKFCATSLESMIDFVISVLGSGDNLKVIATTVIDGKEETEYKITAEAMEMPGDNVVICHPMPYPYTVFYCHEVKATKAYVVPLVGKLGSIVSAVAVCHKNTASLDPIIFKMLKARPGSPLCHFLHKDHLVWVPNNYLNPMLHGESS
ncbi:BURP domain protein [Rhynchospora pubera]|nr:BURP domain protein [Rhynchospora pubera]